MACAQDVQPLSMDCHTAVEKVEREAVPSPTLNGIATLYTECNDTTSDGSGSPRSEPDDLQLPPMERGAQVEDSLRTISNHHLSDHTTQSGPEHEEQQFLQQEQVSEPESEEDEEALRTPPSRYDGHHLCPSQLEWQRVMVQQEKTNAFWERAAAYQKKHQFTHETSRVRAKVLVAEAHYLEKQQLEQQLKWLDAVEHGDDASVSRFGEQFPCPSPHANVGDMIADPALHRCILEEKLHTLTLRWKFIMQQVEGEMALHDCFPNVIRNLSTMRIFVEGDQSPFYGVDVTDQQRRRERRQRVIDLVAARGEGYFLKDALPCPDTPRVCAVRKGHEFQI